MLPSAASKAETAYTGTSCGYACPPAQSCTSVYTRITDEQLLSQSAPPTPSQRRGECDMVSVHILRLCLSASSVMYFRVYSYHGRTTVATICTVYAVSEALRGVNVCLATSNSGFGKKKFFPNNSVF